MDWRETAAGGKHKMLQKNGWDRYFLTQDWASSVGVGVSLYVMLSFTVHITSTFLGTLRIIYLILSYFYNKVILFET